MLEYFRSINQLHWGTSANQWFFYIGILLILIFEKKKANKIVFGWLPVLFLMAVFNPLFYKLFFSVFHASGYYARMFSFIPLMYSIALGFVRVIGKTAGWKKCAAVIVACLTLVYTGNNIYNQEWMQKAQNLEKTPAETFEILNAVNEEENSTVSIAAIGTPSTYIRQVGDVITPYTRYPDEFGNVLAQDPPNVPWVMEQAGNRGLDYIVVNNSETTRAAFETEGYTPYASLNDFLIYKVENVPFFKREYNESRQIVSVTYYNAQGEKAPSNPNDSRSYTTVAYSYDANGYQIKESYFDTEGNPFYTYSGYSVIKKVYSPTGLLERIFYCDGNEQPVFISGRVETRYKHDLIGRVTRESYFDADGRLMSRTDVGYAYRELQYSRKDTPPIAERYYDVQHNPVACNSGYAGIRWDYDDQNRLIRETYLDVDGKAKLIQAGYATMLREYDADGMSYTEKYEDVEGNPTTKFDGYAVASYTVAPDKTIIDAGFYDLSGEPVAVAVDLLSPGVNVIGKDSYRLSTEVEGNYINGVHFQLWDLNSKSHKDIGIINGIGVSDGVYIHKESSGYYRLNFKVNTNKADEAVRYVVYLEQGKAYHYHFNVDVFTPQFVETSEVSWESE